MDQLKIQPPQESKLHFLDYWRIIRIRKTVILAVFLLVVITATVVTLTLPESFMSMARIKVDKDISDITGLNSPQMMAGSGPYDPYFIQTEFEVLKSEIILGDVISQLKLGERWAAKYGPQKPAELINILTRQFLDLRPVRNTSLIEIRCYSEKREEAAEIAEAVAKTYQRYRLDEKQRLTRGGIDALTSRLKDVEGECRQAQTKVDDLREKLKVPDYMVNADAPTTLMTSENLRRLDTLRIESQAELVRMKTLLEKLKNIASNPDELAQAIPTSGVLDQLLTTLLEAETMAEQKLVSLNKEFGPAHSEVVKVAAQVEDLKAKVKDRVVGFLAGMEARTASMEQSLKELQAAVDKARDADIDTAIKTRPYWEAKRSLEEQQRLRMALMAKMFTERTDLELPKTSMVEIVDHAVPGLRPFRPNKTLNISLGVIIGLVVGIGLAFFIEYLDTSVKTIDDVERSLGSPVLGVIPQNVGILLDEGAESPHAEAYRVLRTNLLFSRKEEKLNTLAVVSAGAGEGKSTTVFNLATVFAQSGQRVLMVDSDLRRPTLHKMLRVTNNIGLTNFLLKQNTLEQVIQTTSLPTLDFMASGKLPSSSLGILSSAQMRDLINELKLHYDFVFFDSPPVMGVSDASILASEVDMTLQVIQYRRYPQPMNIRAKQLIEKVGGNLVGIVLNNINMSQDESYYYYSGYYHDYYAKNEDQEPAPAGEGTPEDKA